MPGEFLTLGEMTERYGVTWQTARSWLRDGAIPVAPESPLDPTTGQVLRYLVRVTDADAYVDARKAAGKWGHGKRGMDRKRRDHLAE